MRGATNGAPLAYIVCKGIHPLLATTDPEAEYSTFDQQLIAHKLILKHVCHTEEVAECEAAGAAWNHPEVNADNRIVHRYIVRAVEGTQWMVRIHDTMNSKDGRVAWITLENNFQTQHDLDHKHNSDMSRVRGLTYHTEAERWNMEKYRATHKECHSIQLKLHRDYQYQGIPDRDKVYYFLSGIKNSVFDGVII